MAAMTERGVNSFKHFMAYKGAIMVDDEILLKASPVVGISARFLWSTPRTATRCSFSSSSC